MAKICNLLGVSKNKGVIPETGMAYDYCRLHVMTPFDVAKGNDLGYMTVIYDYGLSDNFAQFVGKQFPCQIEAEFDNVVKGKLAKIVVSSLTFVKK